MKNANFRIVIFGWIIGLAVISLAPAARAQDLPEGDGKEIVQSVCGQCHGLSLVSMSMMTPEEWKKTVEDMIGEGAPLMDDEIPVVIDYLAKNFPKSSVEEKINVNKVAAKDLVDSLHLTAEEVEALVKYRDQNGEFHGWEDLAKVDGLDIKKLEPMKDRLAY